MHPWQPSLALAFVLTPLLMGQGLAQEKTAPARAITAFSPNGWYVDLDADGSGRIGYGSNIMDMWSFKAKTFDIEKVTKDLKALKSDDNGKQGSHFTFGFESERQAPDKPGPARYSRDDKVLPALFERALEAARVKDSKRGALLLEQRPPGLPKRK